MALDFRALLKAERAKTRAKPAEQSGTAPPGGPTTDAPVAESPALQFRLPQTDSRPQLSAAHRVHAAPPAIWHMAEWVSAGEEAALLRCADLSPPHRWTQLRGRRLQNLGGQPRPPPEGFAPEPLPGWVGAVCDALVRAGVFPPDAPPNHVSRPQHSNCPAAIRTDRPRLEPLEPLLTGCDPSPCSPSGADQRVPAW